MRWRPTLSIRTLLLLILLFGIAAAWVGERRRALADRKGAVAAVVELGGSVVFDYQAVPGAAPPGPAALRWLLGDEDAFARIEFVSFCEGQSHLREGDLRVLGKLKEVRVVHLEDPTISDAELVHLTSLESLEVLSISKMKLTIAGAKALKPLRRLRRVIISQASSRDVDDVLSVCLPEGCEIDRE